MARSPPLQVLGLLSLAAHGTLAALDYTQAPPNLTGVEGTQLYSTWRPTSHIVPLYGRMQDPCMHYTDSTTGSFHIGYLWNTKPHGATACKTDDLVTFTDVNEGARHFISPGGDNDPLAVFDGSVIPNGIDGYPTLMYSGVQHLPITWSREYIEHSETQSLAVSRDGGKTFEKLDRGPVIQQPESETQPTAFRDPYWFRSYQLDTLLGGDSRWYVVVAGGVKGSNMTAPGWEDDAGPSQFLYRQTTADDFESWDYLGTWWKEVANSTSSDNKWSVTWGFNQEVSNVCNLGDTGIDNAAGDLFHTHGSEWADNWDGVVRAEASWSGIFHRDMNWSSGNVTRDNRTGLPVFTVTMSSRLDWGRAAYAASGQNLTAASQASVASGVAHDRWIMFVWMTGDFFGTTGFYPPAAQNWTGGLAYPRELMVGHIDRVVDNELAREVPGAWVVESADSAAGTVRLKTLKQVIARETLAALTAAGGEGNIHTTITEPGQAISAAGVTPFAQSPSSRYFVLQANLTFPRAARDTDLQAGFEILANDYERTTLWYQLSTDSVHIDRSESSAAAATTGTGFDLRPERGLLRLFDILPVGGTEAQVETLQLTITVDNSLVEVHINDRFVLTSWIRPWYSNSTGISFFVNGTGSVTYSDVTIHEGLLDAFPDRNIGSKDLLHSSCESDSNSSCESESAAMHSQPPKADWLSGLALLWLLRLSVS